MTVRQLRRLCCVVLVGLAPVACAPLSALDQETPVARYLLAGEEEAAETAGSDLDGGSGTLVVQPMTAHPGFDTSRLIYVETAHQLEHFRHHRWVDAPGRMLTPLLVQALEREGAFATVVQAPTAVVSDRYLQSRLLRLQHEFTTQPSQVRLVVQIRLLAADQAQVLASRHVEIVESAPQATPYGGVVAANRAASRLAREVASFSAQVAP